MKERLDGPQVVPGEHERTVEAIFGKPLAPGAGLVNAKGDTVEPAVVVPQKPHELGAARAGTGKA